MHKVRTDRRPVQFGAKEPGDVGVNPRLNRTIRSSAIGECGNHTHREVEAVEIERPAVHLVPTILEHRFADL
jgi:hypothetical protein